MLRQSRLDFQVRLFGESDARRYRPTVAIFHILPDVSPFADTPILLFCLILAAPLPALTAFTALHSLQTMLEPSGSKSPPISLLVRTMRRALELAGTALRETLSAAPPAPDWPHVFKTITMLATYLINTALPVLVAKTQKRKKTLPTIDVTVADFFGLLATSIFIPLIRSFVPLSLTWMVRLFSAEKEGKLYALTDDIRPNCLSLLRTCIATLNEQTELPVLGSLQHVKERIILETMRELEQLRLQATGETTCCDQASAEILAKGLARKDILWYLVNVLHVTLSPGCQTSSPRSPPDGFDYTSPRTEILRDALLTLLTNLLSDFAGKSDGNREPEPGTAGSTNAYSMRKIDLRLCRKELYADDIGEGMLLAAVERCLAHIRAVA
jgi:hypothetical protein